MADKINPVHETSDEALGLAAKLLGETKYASLAVNETGTDFPLVSRVAACFSQDTGVFFAASDLSVHSKCLTGDPKCSMMLGEPGKGDGLAYARMTLVAETARMSNDDERRAQFRDIFLQTHPKAELYIDFGDFGFYPLTLQRVLLNGGFGKAFHLNEEDLKMLFDNFADYEKRAG